jgi:hypothetical protein
MGARNTTRPRRIEGGSPGTCGKPRSETGAFRDPGNYRRDAPGTTQQPTGNSRKWGQTPREVPDAHSPTNTADHRPAGLTARRREKSSPGSRSCSYARQRGRPPQKRSLQTTRLEKTESALKSTETSTGHQARLTVKAPRGPSGGTHPPQRWPGADPFRVSRQSRFHRSRHQHADGSCIPKSP